MSQSELGEAQCENFSEDINDLYKKINSAMGVSKCLLSSAGQQRTRKKVNFVEDYNH